MLQAIITAAVFLGAVGLLLGVVLAVAYSKLSVSMDEQEAAVIAVLPNVNCGGCGFPGCAGFAEAVVEGLAPVNGCVAGGNEVARKVAEILGAEVMETAPRVAEILCNARSRDKYVYDGPRDCLSAALLAGGQRECFYACLGFGACADVCPFGAMKAHDDLTPPTINPDLCLGCGKCVSICPKKVIALVPKSKKVRVLCSSKASGPDTKKSCESGCIGCRICVRNCPVEAVSVTDNLASIDYDKCVECGICVAKCPRGAISIKTLIPGRFAEIDPRKCTDCGKCLAACPVNAVRRLADDRKPVVFPALCTACSTCVKVCPEQGAVAMKESKAADRKNGGG